MRTTLIGMAATMALATPAAQADEQAENAVLSRVLSAVLAEVSDDHIGAEHLVLVKSADPDADSADLYVFAGAPDDAAGTWLATYEGIAFAGSMSGQQPSLRVAENGSVQILSEQSAIGRSAWQQTLTIAPRDGRLVVAGFTYASIDRAVGATRNCDWNLLTGKWTVTRSGPDLEGKERPDLNLSGLQHEDMALALWLRDADYFPAFCAEAE